MRVIFWLVIYILTLGFISVHVTYVDGLELTLHGWGEKIGKKKKEGKK